MKSGLRGWVKAKLPYRRGRKVLPIMRQVQLGAGLLVLAGLALGTFVNPWFYLVSAFVGAGLTLAGSTGFCGMALVLMKMPWNRVPLAAGGGTCEVGGGASGSCQAGGATTSSCSAGGA
jgi:hypothetical protein